MKNVMKLTHIFFMLLMAVATILIVGCPEPKIKPNLRECMKLITANRDKALKEINKITKWGEKNTIATGAINMRLSRVWESFIANVNKTLDKDVSQGTMYSPQPLY